MLARITFIVGILWVATAPAQSFTGGHDQLIVGGHASIFRISYDGFSRVYNERSGLTIGATGLIKIRPPYYAAVKYHQFEKDGLVVVDEFQQTQRWEEKWYNLGVRYVSYGERKVISYFGFGFAFFNINEIGPVSVFGREPGKHDASGFFLDGGLAYRFIKYASLDFELEVTSAGIEGKSGFEGSSVGGFLFSLGLNLFIL
jgi:hypothetical protein